MQQAAEVDLPSPRSAAEQSDAAIQRQVRNTATAHIHREARGVRELAPAFEWKLARRGKVLPPRSITLPHKSGGNPPHSTRFAMKDCDSGCPRLLAYRQSASQTKLRLVFTKRKRGRLGAGDRRTGSPAGNRAGNRGKSGVRCRWQRQTVIQGYGSHYRFRIDAQRNRGSIQRCLYDVDVLHIRRPANARCSAHYRRRFGGAAAGGMSFASEKDFCKILHT